MNTYVMTFGNLSGNAGGLHFDDSWLRPVKLIDLIGTTQILFENGFWSFENHSLN